MESDSNILIYEGLDGKVKIDVRLQEETVWLTQKMMAELFQTTKYNIIGVFGCMRYIKYIVFCVRDFKVTLINRVRENPDYSRCFKKTEGGSE